MQTITAKERKLLRAYAANNMNATKTAESVYYCRGSVRYQLNRIKEKTGYDPQVFYDLLRLLRMIQSNSL